MHGEVPGWGTAQWGDARFGVRDTTGGPLVIYKSPASNQLDVVEDTFITVQFFDPTYNLNTATAAITVDGVLAYVGSTGFSAGFIGKVSIAAGVLTVRLRGAAGFPFDKQVNVTAYVQDLTDLYTLDNWSFTIRSNPNTYDGLQPLPVEVALQSPFTTFISLEPYRTLLLDNALRKQGPALINTGNKAARVIYQVAFATELSTLLNPYDLYDKTAIASIVAEKENTRLLDKILMANAKMLKADIAAFHKLSGLDPAYLTAFSDYLDSTLYIYRVSLVANTLLFATAYELTQG